MKLEWIDLPPRQHLPVDMVVKAHLAGLAIGGGLVLAIAGVLAWLVKLVGV